MRPESTSAAPSWRLMQLVSEYDVDKAAAKFIGRKAAPIFKSDKKTGNYPIMNRENFKKRATDNRAPDGSYNRITGDFGKGTFACEEYGLEHRVDEALKAEFADEFDAYEWAAKQLWFQTLLNHEYRVHAMYSGGGFSNTNVDTAWSTTGSGVPLTDIQTGIDTIEDKCGCTSRELSLIIPRADFREAMATTQVVNKTLYTYPGVQPASLTAAQFANMLDLKEVLIARGVQDSTEEGVAETNAQIWTAGVMYLALLCNENAQLREPSAARTILWTRRSATLPIVETYAEPKTDAEIVRVKADTDEHLVGETDLFVYKLTNT